LQVYSIAIVPRYDFQIYLSSGCCYDMPQIEVLYIYPAKKIKYYINASLLSNTTGLWVLVNVGAVYWWQLFDVGKLMPNGAYHFFLLLYVWKISLIR